MEKLSDAKIVDSWSKNSSPWITAIQDQQIESRREVTDQAIIDTVMSFADKTVLDIGCGEGWLSHKLSSLQLDVTGVDAIPALIKAAQKANSGKFQVLAYEDISSQTITGKFDTAVCNFSLLGKDSVDGLFKIIPSLLNQNGHLIVQTPHPVQSCGELDYNDGWREGSWAGFDSEFSDPAPWYFRTIASWLTLFIDNDFELVQVKEPIAKTTGKAASIIIVGRKTSHQ